MPKAPAKVPSKVPSRRLASVPNAPKTTTKSVFVSHSKHETFGERVVRLRLAAGMQSPSDLARAIWGEKEDARGFVTANNRDTIWRYEHDQGSPSRKNFALLAKALGVTEAELDPARAARFNRSVQMPDTLEIKIVSREQNRFRLVMDMELPGTLAQDVFSKVQTFMQAQGIGAPAKKAVKTK